MTGQKRILVVEDDRDAARLLQKRLEASGYDVLVAHHGAEALEVMAVKRPDMILSDILMPTMDGFQLCRQVKGSTDLKDIPFVFYTATYTDRKDEEFALSLGAAKFILKPTEPDVLAQIITDVLREHEEGLLTVPEVLPEEESVFFKQYSERLVRKLENKMLQLEGEITERKRAEERIEHLNLVLRAIRGVNQLIIREKDRDRLLKGACDNLIETQGYYHAWIAIFDESGGLVTTAEAGLGKDFLPMVERLKRGELPECGQRALRQSDVVVTEAASSTCTDCPLADKVYGRGAMIVRLEHGEKVYGLVSTSIPAHLTTDEEEQTLFQEVAADIAFGLHSIELEEERKRAEEKMRQLSDMLLQSYVTTTQSLAAAIEAKDVYTRGHSARVSRIAVAIAKELGLSESVIEGVRIAGILHDIGKIGVPGEILSKPGKLTAAEFEVAKSHVEISARIIADIDFPWEVKPMVAGHHERLSGTGYPAGLKGDEILLTARIGAVADVFEAMTSHRPYRPALSFEAAIDELKRGVGKDFDPVVVEALLKVLETQREELASSEAPL